MHFYSTNDKSIQVDLKTAVLQSLAKDKGLYMPSSIAKVPAGFIDHIEEFSFGEVCLTITKTLIGSEIPDIELQSIIEQAINFDAPVVMLNDKMGVLELWHGPSLAFKDFGARFMAQVMGYFTKDENKSLDILVATSGDTGGAVAFGFLGVPGITVTILYPKGKVSPLQEVQLTTLGQNIRALEIDGTFDDCQDLVKKAFLDVELNAKFHLSSANSINIARLIPQTFYYFEAYKQLKKFGKKIVFSVPSGNFGNLTAGLIAKKMGLPVEKFIASTNLNKVVPDYLSSGEFLSKPSIATISNAMDVGNPSNFVRMLDLYDKDHALLSEDIRGCSFTDEQTKDLIKEIYSLYHYVADPHTALAYAGLRDYLTQYPDHVGAFLSTAHPSKFLEVVENVLNTQVDIPERLSILAQREKSATALSTRFEDFKTYLLNR